MTSTLLSRRQLALRIALFSALTAIGNAACRHIMYVYPKNMQGFELPRECPKGSPPRDATQLSACLEGLEFDTTEFIGDEQRLMVREFRGRGLPCFGDKQGFTCRYGPLAKVEPTRGAELYSKRAMSEGRIIARIYLRPDETESYDKFNVAPKDTTYWWVESSRGRSQSQFIRRSGQRGEVSLKERGLTMTEHPLGSMLQPFSRWVWDPTDETLNSGCSGHCCKP
jgi:hypothetical protein